MLAELLRRPVSITIATLALVVIGLFSLARLPVSLLPTLERPRLVVVAQDAQMSRDELRRQVVEPLERRLASLRGVLDVGARIDDGEATLIVDTEWQTDVDRLRIDAERRLAEVAGLGLDELSIEVVSGDRDPTVAIAVLGGGSAHERTLFVDQVLIPEIGRLPGAGRLERLGGALRRPVVRPHAAALAARDLTAADVAERLFEVGTHRPLGRLRDGAEIRPLVLGTEVDSLDGLARVRVGPGLGVPLAELASVSLEEVPDSGVFRTAGEDGVVLEVHRAPRANAVVLVREVRKRLAELAPRAPGLRLVVVRDASEAVVEALRQLATAGLLGLLLGAVVLRWALGSWRPTLALMVVVPASILIAFGGFYLWGVSLDVVSLAGLALAAGMLVDNSIVVLEAIESARQRGRQDPVFQGTRQIALALVASLTTTAVVFLPLLYLRGLARAFFGVQAFGIVTTLAVSLALSLTLTPVLARRLGLRSASGDGQEGTPSGPGLGLGVYRSLLDRALERPWAVLAVTGLVLMAGAIAAWVLERELIPAGRSQTVEIELVLPAGLEPATLHRRAEEIEASVRQATGSLGSEPEIEVWIRDRDPARERREPGTLGEVVVRFEQQADVELGLGVLERLAVSWPGVPARARPRWGAIAQSVRQGADGVELEVSAADPVRAAQRAERLRAEAREDMGLTLREVGAISGEGPRRSAYRVRRAPLQLAALGPQATGDGLAEQVGWALGGQLTGRLALPRTAPEILLDGTLPARPELLPIRLDGGRVVPLSAVASVLPTSLDNPENRRNGRPSVRLEVADASQWAGRRLDAWLVDASLVEGERIELVGHAREMGRAFGQLQLAMGLALVLVFLTISALYESFAMPWVVMITVPVAVAGAMGSLALSGDSFNVMSFLGLILLAGIVVNNAIVLVHRGEQRLAAGEPVASAIRAAALERYRPIVMTTLTTLLGMVPLALLGGEGVELRRSLALAVVGGSLTALVATLVVVPVLYRHWVRRDA